LFFKRLKSPGSGGAQLRHRKVVAVTALLGALVAPALAGGPPLPGLDIVEVAPSRAAYAPGDTVLLGLRLKIPAGYHLYGNPLGPGIGKPVAIRIDGADGVEWLDIKMAPAEKFYPETGDWVWAWEKETAFFPRGIARRVGEERGAIILDGLICNTSCLPLHDSIPFTLLVDSAAPRGGAFTASGQLRSRLERSRQTMAPGSPPLPVAASAGSPFAAIRGAGTSVRIPAWNYRPRETGTGSGLSFLPALLLAFLAGIILNAMPCVLPVLGIKILSFAQGRSGSRGETLLHSLAFASGVMAVFMALAGFTAFANYSWGEHFRNPWALTGLIALIVVFALGLFDVYTLIVPAGLSNLPQARRKGFFGDFFQGIVATLLATPCSGPFLGAVLAWSVTQSPPIIFLVYGALGLGMAFPYVLLSSDRSLVRLIPRPGPWMEDGKRIMGFLLLAFAAYLLAGLPAKRIPGVVFFCVTVAFSVVVFARLAPWQASLRRKLLAALAAAALSAGGWYVAAALYHPSPSMPDASGLQQGIAPAGAAAAWVPFAADSLQGANAAGRTTIVDFTADWCLNCRYNFITALNTPEVVALIREKNILALKVDLTAPDPTGDSLLHSLGSRSLPFLAIFPGNRPDEPIVMRDIVLKSRLLKVLRQVN
jgi:thiol:disulfide interchange protein DsbD